VLPNPVGFLRLYHAQKPNRYRARGTPDVSLPAIAARPLVNTASGIVQFRVQSEVSTHSDQVRFDAISGPAQVKGGSLRDRLKLSGPRSPPLPLGSPVQSQTAVRVWVQQLFALGPTLERGELRSRCLGRRFFATSRAPRSGAPRPDRNAGDPDTLAGCPLLSGWKQEASRCRMRSRKVQR